jgi:murein DD-endopeptidase MepM/ murein hydrolase activator NlpD
VDRHDILRNAALFLLAAHALPGHGALESYPFNIVTVTCGDETRVFAQNGGAAPVSTHVAMTGDNVRPAGRWPATVVVPPRALTPLDTLTAEKHGEPYAYTFKYSYYVGNLESKPAARSLYRLPFEDGRAFRITQAHDGPLSSHDNPQNRYAVDFAMPVGTPVLAAREGMVAEVILDYSEGGYDPELMDRVNMITIAHADGTIAEYAHLSPGDALVKPGQWVQAGTPIGHSGNTGYSTGPHLHFVVAQPALENGRGIRRSLPVSFYLSDFNNVFEPETGSMATAHYQSAVPFKLADDETVPGNSIGAGAGTPAEAGGQPGVQAPVTSVPTLGCH